MELQYNQIGYLKISIPIPNSFDTAKLLVYRVSETGDKTEYKVDVETIDGIKYATFETDHFSTYVLAETKTVQSSVDTSNGNNKLDVTPTTGEISIIGILLGIAALSLAGIIILKRKK